MQERQIMVMSDERVKLNFAWGGQIQPKWTFPAWLSKISTHSFSFSFFFYYFASPERTITHRQKCLASKLFFVSSIFFLQVCKAFLFLSFFFFCDKEIRHWTSTWDWAAPGQHESHRWWRIRLKCKKNTPVIPVLARPFSFKVQKQETKGADYAASPFLSR